MLDYNQGRQNDFAAMPRLINGKGINKFKDPYGTNIE
jgi:hypothetical protein